MRHYISLAVLCLTAVCLAGCATPRPDMSHVDDDADYDRDHSACVAEAESSMPESRSVFSGITTHDSVLENKIVLCMTSKGWKLIRL